MKKDASTLAYVYLIFAVLTIAVLSWQLFDTKFVAHSPQFQTVELLPPVEAPSWQASDSATLSESQKVLASQLTAQAYLVMDLNSRTILTAKNSDKPMLPASTTKLMTALATLELYDLDEIVTVSTTAAQGNDGGGLFPYERLTVRDLLIGLLVSSANDSAYALAEHAAGGETEFLAKMNELAQRFNLEQTKFFNPAGYDEPANTSTARDLAVLTMQVVKQPRLLEWLATDRATVYNVDQNIRHLLFTTNELLGKEPRIIAGKTGTTPLAGEVLMSVVELDNHPLLIIIMASQDRYADTNLLLQWLTNNIAWQKTGFKPETPQPSQNPLE